MNSGIQNITKDPAKAGRKGGLSKKGKKHKLTKLKDKIGVDRTEKILGQIEKNIDEFVNHKDGKIRLDATKAFTDYYKPRKREHTGNFKGTIVLTTNPKILNENNNQDTANSDNA